MSPLLELTGLHAAYGPSAVLHGIDLQVAEGGIATLLGANGAGKTTTLRAICQMMVAVTGEIRFAGEPSTGWRPRRSSGVASRMSRTGAALSPI
jgi:branched-chain amino acid transport system ATP-binding protein